MNPALSEAVFGAVHGAGERFELLQRDFRAVQLGGPRGEARKVSFMIFNPGAATPTLVVKASRDARVQSRLKEEFTILQQVSNIPELQGQVPRPISCFEFEGEVFTVETCVAGISLATLLRHGRHVRHRHVSRDVGRIIDWLEDFQASTGSAGDGIGPDELWNDLETHLPRGRLPVTLQERLKDLCRSIGGHRIGLVGRHGDPWPGNVFFDGSFTGMIDWDGFSGKESPFDDVLHALITYAQTYPWHGTRWINKAEAFRLSFLSDNWWSRILSRWLARYLSRKGLSWKTGELFLVLLLARRSEEQQDSRKSFWPVLLELYAREHQESVFRRPRKE